MHNEWEVDGADVQCEEMGNELAAISTSQEGGKHGAPDHEGLHPLDAGVLKVQQGQSGLHAVAPLHICSPPCSKAKKGLCPWKSDRRFRTPEQRVNPIIDLSNLDAFTHVH